MEAIKDFLKQLNIFKYYEAKVEAKIFCKYVEVKRLKKQRTNGKIK